MKKQINNSEERIYVGLDIGTTKLAMVAGKQNEDGKLEIIGYEVSNSKGVRRGTVINVQKTVDGLKELKTKMRDDFDIEVGVVHLGIAGKYVESLNAEHSIIRKNPRSMITEQEINDFLETVNHMLKQPGKEVIHLIPQEYIIDDESGITDVIGAVGTSLKCKFHAVVADVAAVEMLKTCVTMADMDIANIMLEPIASAKAVLEEQEKEGGVVLVDIGGGTTDIAIIKDDIVRHTCVIPFGGEAITEDLKNGLSLLKDEAEICKINYGNAIPADVNPNDVIAFQAMKNCPAREFSLKAISEIISARLTEILETVNYEIKLSEISSPFIGGIVLTGGGSLIKNTTQLASYITGMSARIGNPSHLLSHNTPNTLLSPQYSTVIGLLLNAIENDKYKFSQNNKLNDAKVAAPQEKKEKKRKFDIFGNLSNFFD